MNHLGMLLHPGWFPYTGKHMKKNFIVSLATVMVLAGILSGCGKSEQKQEAEKASQMSKYQEMAAQRGMSRGGGAGGGAGAPGQPAAGTPTGN